MGLPNQTGDTMSKDNRRDSEETGVYHLAESKGITPREFFAGLAMHAMMSIPSFAGTSPKLCARLAIERADALLEALK